PRRAASDVPLAIPLELTFGRSDDADCGVVPGNTEVRKTLHLRLLSGIKYLTAAISGVAAICSGHGLAVGFQ
ncbi:hypothetical protein, partial [Mesorhizobium silamurunense]|uniref:hypothetical protein n=1 Tax=Mesorhizobium silamurunense TaxID=499528 RepID=UPI001AEE3670